MLNSYVFMQEVIQLLCFSHVFPITLLDLIIYFKFSLKLHKAGAVPALDPSFWFFHVMDGPEQQKDDLSKLINAAVNEGDKVSTENPSATLINSETTHQECDEEEFEFEQLAENPNFEYIDDYSLSIDDDGEEKSRKVSFAEEQTLVTTIFEEQAGDAEQPKLQDSEIFDWTFTRDDVCDNNNLSGKSWNASYHHVNEHRVASNKGRANIPYLFNATIADLFARYPNVDQNVQIYPVLHSRRSDNLAIARSRDFDREQREKRLTRTSLGGTPTKSGTNSKRSSQGPGSNNRPRAGSLKPRRASNAPSTTSRRSNRPGHPKPGTRRASSSVPKRTRSITSSHRKSFDPSTATDIYEDHKYEDTESNDTCCRRCPAGIRRLCKPCRKCCSSRQCTTIAFFSIVILVTLTCIFVVTLPVLKGSAN